MTYDKRKPGVADVAAWTEAAHRANWTLREARDAVLAHFAYTTDYLMPGHVTARIQAERRQPPPVRALNSGGEQLADPCHIAATLRQLRAELGWPQPSAEDSQALAVACPHCGAGPQQRCRRPQRGGGTTPLKALHPSRLDRSKEKNP